jgi:hypothetical protein
MQSGLCRDEKKGSVGVEGPEKGPSEKGVEGRMRTGRDRRNRKKKGVKKRDEREHGVGAQKRSNSHFCLEGPYHSGFE